VLASAPGGGEVFGCLLDPSHNDKNDKDDYGNADDSDAAVTIPVPIAAEAATESAEQKYYENDDEDESDRHRDILSFQR
jgi:hypothetical protein